MDITLSTVGRCSALLSKKSLFGTLEGPMAVVILGGLRSSMALNLLVLPTLALRYGRFEPAVSEQAIKCRLRTHTQNRVRTIKAR